MPVERKGVLVGCPNTNGEAAHPTVTQCRGKNGDQSATEAVSLGRREQINMELPGVLPHDLIQLVFGVLTTAAHFKISAGPTIINWE